VNATVFPTSGRTAYPHWAGLTAFSVHYPHPFRGHVTRQSILTNSTRNQNPFLTDWRSIPGRQAIRPVDLPYDETAQPRPPHTHTRSSRNASTRFCSVRARCRKKCHARWSDLQGCGHKDLRATEMNISCIRILLISLLTFDNSYNQQPLLYLESCVSSI